MSQLSDELELIVLGLLEEFGELATFSRVVEGAYVPGDGSVGAGTSSNFTAYVVPNIVSNNEKPDSIVKDGAHELLAMHATSEPLIGDKVTYDSRDFRIQQVDKTRLSGNTLLYTLRVHV